MELHSYAKTRSNRIWTIEQKRKLVDNRITLDVLFNKKAFNISDSWRKLMKVSDFDCFDILFVRKQWTNTLTKYKCIVMRYTNDSAADIDDETRETLTNEWEFFDKIYTWVKYKESLHINYNNNYNNIILEELENENFNEFKIQNQQHNNNPHNIIYNQETIINPKNNNNAVNKSLNYNLNIKSDNLVDNNNFMIPRTRQLTSENSSKLNIENVLLASTSSISSNIQHKINKKKLLKNRNRKKRHHHLYTNLQKSTINMEHKLNAFCQIFAQIVDRDYPDINTNDLLTSNNNNSIIDTNTSNSSSSDT